MADPTTPTSVASRWPHRWAVLTVCAALPLLVLGSLVTTLKAGMVDKLPFRWPWYLLTGDVKADAEQSGYALHLYFLEHSHRFAGWIVGFLSVALCLSVWFCDRRAWMRKLGTGAMLAVGVQGFLGGGRVQLDKWIGTDLAAIHGCVAQIVFGLLVSAVLCSSSWWTTTAGPRSRRLAGWTLATSILIFIQIVFGAVIRHSSLRLGQRLHFLIAFAVMGVIVWLMTVLREDAPQNRRMKLVGHVLAIILVFQVSLGVEAWMLRFPPGVLPDMVPISLGLSIVRSLHFAFGTMLFATSVVLTLLARAPIAPPVSQPLPHRERVMEGVA